MKICKFRRNNEDCRVGLIAENETVIDLTPIGILTLEMLLESESPVEMVGRLSQAMLPQFPLSEVFLCAPVDRQEIWAAGVTYSRSKAARMEESEFSATAYDRVYSAARPELFFKALAEKVVGPQEPVGIRQDAKWNVPEPELALVLTSKGRIAGYTIGNDMSSRDIEGENLLYLPQAKIYSRSCALGPWLEIGPTESEARQWAVRLAIKREGKTAFSGETSVDRIKRSFEELVEYLFRSQAFPHGAILLTGTGVIPPENFTLESGDHIQIEITGIGLLRNQVVTV